MKKSNIIKAAFALLGIATAPAAMAQHTGSYDTSLTFMGAARTFSMYVPTTYDATHRYRLIVGLHGLGDNSVSYRNGLVTSLGWGTSIPNTIFVCPEAFSTNADYYYPTGDDSVIQASINLAMRVYHIDSADVILQGFSLGGRAALRYGLDNYTKFKGLLLNTPAVQGVKDALNGTGYNFTYANAPHIPIYITHGLDDILYESPIDTAYEQLVLHDGIVRYYEFPGLAHAIPPIASILNFIPYFDTPTVHGYDADVVKPVIAQRSCVTSVPATCLIRSTGSSTIHSVKLNYTVGGSTLSYNWVGTLAPFQHAIVTLPTISAPVGFDTLDVVVANIDTTITDTVTANNEKKVPFQVVTTGTHLPLSEGFEGVFPPTNWVQYLAGDAYTPWYADSTTFRSGIASMGTFNTILIFDNSGRREGMASPLLDLTSVSSPYLTFDVSYNYHHYTPPTLTVDTVFADTLEILISTDCGDTYNSLYRKGGTDLATFHDPILNPTTIDADFIVPADSNWRTENVSLGAYSGSDKAIVKFNYISALGGSINIDNVRFSSGTTLSVPEVPATGYSLAPNPASSQVIINAGTQKLVKVAVIDVTGKTVLEMQNSNGDSSILLHTATLTDGVYVVRMFTENGVKNAQLIIKK